MQEYYDCGGGGCFDGSCSILMSDNTTRPIESLKKGDILWN